MALREGNREEAQVEESFDGFAGQRQVLRTLWVSEEGSADGCLFP